jgi:hypothetical protein
MLLRRFRVLWLTFSVFRMTPRPTVTIFCDFVIFIDRLSYSYKCIGLDLSINDLICSGHNLRQNIYIVFVKRAQVLHEK